VKKTDLILPFEIVPLSYGHGHRSLFPPKVLLIITMSSRNCTDPFEVLHASSLIFLCAQIVSLFFFILFFFIFPFHNKNKLFQGKHHEPSSL